MKHILIIEDDLDMREALQTKLTASGYRVSTAEDAEHGLHFVLQDNPDLILLDLMTHSMHGVAFLNRLHGLGVKQGASKVIVLTNLDNDVMREKIDAFGIEAYLVKTKVSLEDVAKAVQSALGE